MKRIACIVALSLILINSQAQKENSFRVIAFFTAKNDPAHISFVVGETIRLFGAGRCMFGSNFPIEKLWIRYDALVDAYRAATQTLSAADRQAIFHDTAAGIYRLA